MAINRGLLFTVLLAAVAAELVGNASAATYVVGDSLGWTVPPNPNAYATWASGKVFQVGDIFVFNFTTGFHDVARVTKGAYDGCSSSNPIALVTVGPSNFTLSAAGEDHYICTFGSHCSLGQKLAINVTGASSPSPAPSPPTIPTPTPSPSTPVPTPTPTPSPSRSPSPSPSPSGSPSASPSGAPAPAPGSTPPSPSGGASPPAPGEGPSPSGGAGDVTPPPPPNSATIAAISAPLVLLASVAFGLLI